jgi:hypothetical protein
MAAYGEPTIKNYVWRPLSFCIRRLQGLLNREIFPVGFSL